MGFKIISRTEQKNTSPPTRNHERPSLRRLSGDEVTPYISGDFPETLRRLSGDEVTPVRA